VTRLRKMMLEELERRNYSEGTIRRYLRYVERFAQHFGKSPDKLCPDHLRTYQAYLLKVRKLDPGSVENHVSALRFLFIRTLHRHEFRQFLPYPKLRRKLPKILSLEEVTRLIDASSGLFERTLLMVLYGTGMRRAEIARLKIADIDSQRMVIHVVNGKGGKDRDLPLSPKLLETLRAYWRWLQPQTYLFPLANESRRRATDHRQDRVARLLGSGQKIRHPQERDTPFASPQLGNSSAGSRNRPAHHPASTRS
jgi:integrase/recombinase XerD